MKTSQKGFISPLLLALIAVLVIGGGAYVYVEKKQGNRPMAQTSNSQMADWKTYANSLYGFSFRYPSNFVMDNQNTNKITIPVAMISTFAPLPNAQSMDQIEVVKTSALPMGSLCSKNIISNRDMLDTGWVDQAGGQYRALCFISEDITLVVTSATSRFTKAIAESVLKTFKFNP